MADQKDAVAAAALTTDQKSTVVDAMKQLGKFATADGYDNFLSRLGLNNNNALSAGTYEFNLITRNRILIEAGYRGSWIVGMMVDAVAEDMTRAGIDIQTAEAKGTAGKGGLRDLRREMTRLQIWSSLCSVIKWGRMYGGSIGVMQIEGQDLSTPLRLDTIAKGQFKGIVAYDRWQLNPIIQDPIESGPNMGLPSRYQIVNDPREMEPSYKPGVWYNGLQTVHHSRCIRYVGIELPYFQAITEMMWGESVLERAWDRLISFDNATMSSASLIDRANLRTVGIDGLREIIAAGGPALQGLEAFFEMMRLKQVNEGLTLLDKNDVFTNTSYSFSGLSDMMLQFGQQLAGATGTPLVRLFGQSPAGLNSTGEADLRMYYDNINAQQEARLRNSMDLVLRIMWRSTFGTPAPDDLEFTFTPLWQQTPTDKANNAKTTTETVLGALQDGAISRATAMAELRDSSGETGIFSNITDEDIEEAKVEEPPMPDEEPSAEPSKVAPDEEKNKEPVKNLDSRWKRVRRSLGFK
jgi:phage-related protein (TIGR01555 family)